MSESKALMKETKITKILRLKMLTKRAELENLGEGWNVQPKLS
jgi:hypothetical protein